MRRSATQVIAKKYQKRISVRMSDEEHSDVRVRANLARLSTSRFLVSCALSMKIPKLRECLPPSAEDREQLELLVFELRKIGTNLNQIAYRANHSRLHGRLPPPRWKVEQAADSVKGLIQLIRNRL